MAPGAFLRAACRHNAAASPRSPSLPPLRPRERRRHRVWSFVAAPPYPPQTTTSAYAAYFPVRKSRTTAVAPFPPDVHSASTGPGSSTASVSGWGAAVDDGECLDASGCPRSPGRVASTCEPVPQCASVPAISLPHVTVECAGRRRAPRQESGSCRRASPAATTSGLAIPRWPPRRTAQPSCAARSAWSRGRRSSCAWRRNRPAEAPGCPIPTPRHRRWRDSPAESAGSVTPSHCRPGSSA